MLHLSDTLKAFSDTLKKIKIILSGQGDSNMSEHFGVPLPQCSLFAIYVILLDFGL